MKQIIENISEDSFFFGIIFILLSVLLLLFRIYFNESSKMEAHSAASWKAYINSWVFIAMLFIIGISLLFH
jgi:hypothetical protein